MQTSKKEYRKFLNDNFKGLRLRKPLFYSWNIGLRFDLQVGSTNTEEYFQEVTRRASIIFKSLFDSSDEVFIVLMDYKYKRRKIRFLNYVFYQIANLQKDCVRYLIEKRIYEPNDKFDRRIVAVTKVLAEKINYKNILTAIGHTNFPPREPRLDRNGVLTDKEVYFINSSKRLIFHMYDDRGLDIIATDKETIRPIYENYNSWLLDYDRERIDKQFN